MLNIGLIFVVVNFRLSNDIDNDTSLNSVLYDSGVINRLKLKLKFFGGPCNGEVYIFEPKEKW